ncbi:MAG: histidine kinase dimerization/phosphoacceptor domain -containing protein [Cyanobacteria bacterium P01_A01_bin.114]
MITSLEDIDSINQAFESGATDYITKPIHWALLPHRMRHLQDILERQRAEQQIKASLREKEALLKEIHHRVKNNLQIISSLLNLQSSSIKDKQTLELFQISQNRVHLIALIHEKLYQSNDLGKINFRSYFQDLCDYLLRSYKLTPNSVSLMIEIDDFSLEIDTAVSCGLIINELMSNSLKYAFREFDSGVIQIKANLIDEAHFTISFRDNGVGLPQSIDTENSESLGLKIIFNLTEQLGGSLVIKRDNGTEFELTHLSL